jgi:DNA repair protein RecN (Recombination protein N)
MLSALSIRDIVLIDRADLEFSAGLVVLTGETGAGKSILLDALGLALGERAEARLVRQGVKQGSVSAEFDVSGTSGIATLLEEQGIPGGDTLILRRTLQADGRSRAFVNDEPVSVGFLRHLGETLVEVHGQHDGRGLLQPSTHRVLLDTYGHLNADVARCRKAYEAVSAAREALEAARERLDRARREEDYLRHVHAELEELGPVAGEEHELAQQRALLREGERIAEALQTADAALSGGDGADARLRTAQRAIERIADKAEGRLDRLVEALDRTGSELLEAMDQVQTVMGELGGDPARLSDVEDRLFALREAARKHRVTVDDLPALMNDFADRLATIDHGEADLARLDKAAAAAETAFAAAVETLSAARRDAAARLDKAVAVELPPLALEKAVFGTSVERREPGHWSGEGGDDVLFRIATNPGQTPDALNRVASGGEMARVMLAIKVALAETRDVRAMIFDEVDQGIGGATADKVGERLARLAGGSQVLVVTHSPQVAARADHHWRIEKIEADGVARTIVRRLQSDERREEIARMLAGAEVTDEARAAAERLLVAKTA